MQDEVNEKTMALCIKGGKISAQLLKAALTKLLSEIEKKKQQSKKMGGQNRCKRGKQSIKSLQQSGAQLTNIVVTDNNIKSFDRVARKYGIDYSLKKAEKEGKTEYLVFFKAKDVDVTGRGLSVLMLEAQDLACATSSASSKLIHGGLRYLEHYEFRLVSEALAEREVLLKMAPHIAFPMRFRLPHRPHLRPAWMIRIGLFMYDHLGKRTSLPGSTGLRFGANSVLKPEIKRGFEYSDCWVDDARLVLANAQMVVRKGGEVLTRTRATSARRENGLWIVEAEDIDTGKKYSWQARGLVNATGPWVKQFFDDGMHLPSPYGIRLIKGSHIVVPRVHTQKQAYILQNEDKRIVFVIPWMDEFSIIGTTDVEYKGDPKAVKIEESEINYLLKVYNAHFKKQLSRDDIVWTYSGVRPLCDDESDSPQAITRDYTLDIHDENGKAPLLSVFGGKLTTYRKLAEHALEKLTPYYQGIGPAWTKESVLPCGAIEGDRDDYAAVTRS